MLTLRGPAVARRGAALQDLGIIEDGSVLIKDGRIASVGATRRIENLKEAKGAVEIPLNGALLMPGFVDTGIQLGFYEHAGGARLLRKRKKMAAFHDESLALLRACLLHGTLNAQTKIVSSALDPVADLAALRQLARIGNNPVGTVRSWRLPGRVSDQAALAAWLARLRNRKLAQAVEIRLAESEFPFDDPGSDPIWRAVSQSGLAVSLIWEGGYAKQLEVFCELAQAHCVFCRGELNVADCAVLAASHAIAVFSPYKDLLEERSNLSVLRIAETGGAIALASGYDSSDAPAFNMQMIVALAVLRMHLTVEQAITATTINAAYALHRGAEIGSIEVGKRADLIVLSLADYREIPRRMGTNHVSMVIRDGNLVVNRNRPKASGA